MKKLLSGFILAFAILGVSHQALATYYSPDATRIDSNMNGLVEPVLVVPTAAATTTLIAKGHPKIVLTGTTTQTVVMPDARILYVGTKKVISNESSQSVTVDAGDGSTLLQTLTAGESGVFTLKTNATQNGGWNVQVAGKVSSAGSLSAPTVTGTLTVGSDIAMSGNSVLYSYSGGTAGTVRAGVQMDGSGQDIRFFTATLERARVFPSGNVAIGSTSDGGALLQVAGSESLTGSLSYGSTQPASAASLNLSGTKSYASITGSTTTSLTGITAGVDGQVLDVFSNGATVQVANASGSAPGNGTILTGTGGTIQCNKPCMLKFIYDATATAWALLSARGANGAQ